MVSGFVPERREMRLLPARPAGGGWLPARAGSPGPTFTPIRPGGQREPLIYDPKGYFVISLNRAAGQIVLRHYLPDHTPAHEMRGRGAETMLLGLSLLRQMGVYEWMSGFNFLLCLLELIDAPRRHEAQAQHTLAVSFLFQIANPGFEQVV